MSKLTLIPRLVVRDAPRAIAWYVEHLGARELERFADGDTIVHVDELGARLERGGAKAIFPIQDQEYGERGGRFADPFGHLWILSRKL